MTEEIKQNQEIDKKVEADAAKAQLESAVDTEQSSEPTVDELKESLQLAKEKAEQNWELYLSAKAEVENIKKRAEREVISARKYALEKFIAELLSIKDSLEMGTVAAEEFENKELEKFIEGSELTIKMFKELFNRFDISEVNPKNETFNPELHQAMTTQGSDDCEPNTVIEVIQKGYQLNDRLLRPALVIVSK